jgi:hypothetical protein
MKKVLAVLLVSGLMTAPALADVPAPEYDPPGNSGDNGNNVSGSSGNQASERGQERRREGAGENGNAGGSRGDVPEE